MNLEEFLKRFGNEYHIEIPRGDREVSTLVINGEVTLHLKAVAPHSILLYSMLCQVPKDNKPPFFEEILRTNLYGTQTGGMVFGLDEGSSAIIQSYRFEQEPAGYEEIIGAIKKFVGVYLHYKKEFLNKAAEVSS